MCVKGGSSETRWLGKSAKCEGLHDDASYLRETTQRRITFFTVARPRKTQYRSLKAVSVALIPECLTRSWVCLITSFTKECFAGKRIGDLLEVGSEALEIRPLHLIVWFSLRNNLNWATRIGGVDLELFRLRKESSSTNAVVCTDLIHKVSEFINSSAVNSWFKSPLFFPCALFLRLLTNLVTYAVTPSNVVMLL